MILLSLGLGTNKITPAIDTTDPDAEPPTLIFQDDTPAELYFMQGDNFPTLFFVRK